MRLFNFRMLLENDLKAMVEIASKSKSMLNIMSSGVTGESSFRSLSDEHKEDVLKELRDRLNEVVEMIEYGDFDDSQKTLVFKYFILNFGVFFGGDRVYFGGEERAKFYKLLQLIEHFFRVKRFCNEKNLLNIKIQDLKEVVDEGNISEARWNEKEEVKKKQAELYRRIDSKAKVFDAGEIAGFKVSIPLNMEGACKVGRATKWCTASTEDDFIHNRFSQYDERGDLIACVDLQTGKKYQIHRSTKSMMDELDEPVSDKEIISRLKIVEDEIESKVRKKGLHKNIKVPSFHKRIIGHTEESPTGKIRDLGTDFRPDRHIHVSREFEDEHGDYISYNDLLSKPVSLRNKIDKQQCQYRNYEEHGYIRNSDHKFTSPHSLDDEIPNYEDDKQRRVYTGLHHWNPPTAEELRKNKLDRAALKRSRQHEIDYEHRYESVLDFLNLKKL